MVYKVSFELLGEMPLLMHRDNIEGSELLKEWRQDPKNKNQSVPGDDRTPAWTWATYLYDDGEFVTMPQDNVMRALMTGGTQVILKKQKTFKELSQTAILMATEHLRFEFSNGKQLSMTAVSKMQSLTFPEMLKAAEVAGFRLFCKRAKIGQAKHIRVRPRFDSWKVSGECTITSPDIPLATLQLIFDYAGRAGLGDWRPSSPKSPGPYGMFTTKLKVI